ncbi:MAG: hypothetical protein J5590_08650 [Clostridia bacterium]|nr:hypothetical protein [Clostridia bacterium]
MGDATIQYKCPACGAALKFSANDGELKCDACGNQYKIEALQMLAQSDATNTGFDWSEYKEAFGTGETLDNTVVYNCLSCGATVQTDATTAATHCPYCDNEIVINERLTGGIKPNYIIPFKIDKKGLKDKVAEYAKGKKLLPKNFFSEQVMDKIMGVYVPFWLFDAELAGEMDFDASSVKFFTDSRYSYTKTDHFLIKLNGKMNFSKVPVDGSTKMDDDLMDALEPFDYSQMVPFDTSYLSGFLADRFDENPDKSLPRASKRMLESATDAFSSQISSSYSSSSMRSNRMKISQAAVKYAMLPVYLININYDNKKYRFAVNGQTGKTVGELPVSKKRKWFYFFKTAAITAAIVSLIAFWLFR